MISEVIHAFNEGLISKRRATQTIWRLIQQQERLTDAHIKSVEKEAR